MATTSPIATSITIGGALLGSFGGMIRQSKLGLLSLQTTAIKVNSSISGIGKGLLGLTGSFLAFEGIKGFLTESVKLAKEEAGTHAALVAIITNQNHLRGIGTQQSLRQVEAIERQSKALQEQSGIYKEIFSHGAAQLKVFKLSTAQIQAAQPQIANLMAFQKQMGQDTSGDYEALGKAALTGMTKGLKGIGIEFTQLQSQIFKVMSVSQRWSMIIREIQRQHGGAASARGKTLGGQAELAQIHWKETMETIGESFKPVFQKLTIFFGEIGNIIAPPLIKLSRFIAENFDSWVKIVKQSVIPVIRSMVKQGWDYLSGAIVYFKNNSSWLVPWITEVVKAVGIWTFVIGPLIGVILKLREALILLQLANPWGLIAIAAGVAAYEVITHWTEVKRWFAGFYEWMVGTKVFNATLEPEGVKRAFKKGEVPKAQPVQKGFLSWFWKDNINDEDPFNKWLASSWTRFEGWNDKIETAWDNTVLGWVNKAKEGWNSTMTTMKDGLIGVGQVIQTWLIDKIKTLTDKWQEFLNFLNPAGPNSGPVKPGGVVPGRVPGTSNGGRGITPSGIVWAPNGLPFTTYTSSSNLPNARFNNPGAMGLTKSALMYGGSPSGIYDTGHAFARFPTREQGAAAQFSMWWNGAYRNHTLAEAITNWIGPGEHGEAEAMSKWTGIPLNARITDDILRGPEGIRLMQAQARYEGANVLTPGQWKSGQDMWKARQFGGGSGAARDVHVHYNVTNHIHGGDVEHKMATLHHRHLEQMKKDLEDATASKHRSAFV